VEFSLELVVEAICPTDTSGFMIPSQKKNLGGIFNFEAEKVHQNLERIIPTINVIPDEEISGLRWRRLNAKYFKKVIELTVDIADNDDRIGKL
jgi:hypothetical protein